MGVYDQTHKHCPKCRKSTLHYRQGVNHVLHLLITIFLCGFWLPVWLWLAIRVGGWRCQACGSAAPAALKGMHAALTPLCPACKTLLADPLIKPGDLITCPDCGDEFIVPKLQTPPRVTAEQKEIRLRLGLRACGGP